MANIPNINNFDVLVRYFRASDYFKLRPYLDNIPQIRILAGINVDQIKIKDRFARVFYKLKYNIKTNL